MPLYDVKLISPFAVRFSQARIRPTFQDGRSIEDTIEEITSIPHNDEYDQILCAPFEPIEVIKCRPRLLNVNGESGVPQQGALLANEEHQWYTFDNRRLYCLQRAAARGWPRKTAAVVTVLYDMPLDRNAVRKIAAATAGVSVQVSRLHDTACSCWAWTDAARGLSASPAVMRNLLWHIQANEQREKHTLAEVPEHVLRAQEPPKNSSQNSIARLFDMAKSVESCAPPPVAASQLPSPLRSMSGGAGLSSAPPPPPPGIPQSGARELPPSGIKNVAQLFQIASACEADEAESAWIDGHQQRAAGHELLSMLKGSQGESAHVHNGWPCTDPPVPPELGAVYHGKGYPTGNHSKKGHGAVMFGQGFADPGKSAGSEILGLIRNPDAAQAAPSRADMQSDIWSALGRAPPSRRMY